MPERATGREPRIGRGSRHHGDRSGGLRPPEGAALAGRGADRVGGHESLAQLGRHITKAGSGSGRLAAASVPTGLIREGAGNGGGSLGWS
jgi:hypothetical protein